MLRVRNLLLVLVVLALLVADSCAAEKSDLQAYLDEIKFDTASHQQAMRRKLSDRLCPELRARVGSLASETE